MFHVETPRVFVTVGQIDIRLPERTESEERKGSVAFAAVAGLRNVKLVPD